MPERKTESDQRFAEAVRLLEYALNLRMYGEGKGETQADWDSRCETFLRSIPPGATNGE